MTPEERRAYHRAWRAGHPGYHRAWLAAHPDYLRRWSRDPAGTRRTWPCVAGGCEAPRHVYPAGVVASRCVEHLRAKERARYRSRAKAPTPPELRRCLGDPDLPKEERGRCPRPRFVDEFGRIYTRCEDHFNPREVQRRRAELPLAPMQYRSKPEPKPRRDPRYNTARWLRLRYRVLGMTARHRTPTALCWWPDVDPHPAEVVDHIVPVYVGMPDAEFYGLHNLRPSCQAHNKARGFLAAAGRGPVDPQPGRSSIFRRARR